MAASLVDRGVSDALFSADRDPGFIIGQTSHSHFLEHVPHTTVFQRCVNANTVLDIATRRLQELDMRALSVEEYTLLETDVTRIYNYATNLVKRNKKELSPEQRNQLLQKACALKLGGKISPEFVNSKHDFGKFAQSNHLHHSFFRVRLQLHATSEGIPVIPYVDSHGVQHQIAWNHLQKIEREEGGFSYKTPEGYIVFEVNDKFELLPSYTYNYQGFHHYSFIRSDHLLPVDTRFRIPGDHDYYIDVVVSTSKSQGDGIGGCSQQHAYFEFGDPEYKYSIGRYANFEELSNLQQACVTGVKRGEIHSPDEYALMAKDQRNITRTRLILSKSQFERLKARFMQDKRERHPAFTVLKRNCTAYVTTVLKEVLDISVDAEIPVGEYVYYYMPQIVRTPLNFIYKKMFRNLPLPFQGGISLVCKPFYYLYCLAVGIFAKSLSMVNHEEYSDFDITWKEILTNTVTVMHPTRLRGDLRTRFPRGWSDISARG